MRGVFTALLFYIILVYPRVSNAQVTVSGANVGNGSYATLNAAFTAINGGSQSGATISITITANTIEWFTSAVLNSGTWNSLTIKPSGAVTVFSGATIAIDLNGADNVTINGLNTGGNSLTIDNETNSASSAAIRFINDASNNTITNCTLLNSSDGTDASGQGAVVWFSTAATTGNDNNTISYCNITGAYILSIFNSPSQGIRSNGSSSLKSNDNNTIDHCNIYDFGTDASASASMGINIADYSSGWTITNNDIFESSTLSFATADRQWKGIYINVNNTTNAGGFTITGNTIGYSNSSATGTTTISGSTNMIYGIVFNAQNGGSTSAISNNIIAGFNQTTSRSPTASGTGYQVFAGILVNNGPATVSGNIIGVTSGTGSITINSQQSTISSTSCVVGILNLGSSNNAISGNQIGGIAIQDGGASKFTMSFAGIRNESTGAVTISGNTIGNSSANNITSSQTGAGLIGIYLGSSSGTVSVSSNTLQNFHHSGQNTGTGTSASVIGILCNGTGGTYSLSQNNISSLANSYSGSSAAIHVYGMLLNQSGNGHTVSRNKIYDVQLSNANTSATVDAIRISGGTMSIYNNLIGLGSPITTNPTIVGIELPSGTPTPSIYFNTILINGSYAGAAASSTYALKITSNSSGTQVVDNIFYNVRSTNASSSNWAFYCNAIAQVNNLTACNYNNFYVSGTGTKLLGYAANTYNTVANWNTATGKDANSLSQSVTFISTTGSNAGFLHINRTSCASTLSGTPIAGITTDYDGDSRSATAPSMGADEIGYVTWTGATSTDWNTSTNWNNGLVPTIYYDVTVPSGVTNNPIISTTTATCHSLTINSGATLSMQSSGKLTIDATCSSGSFTNNGTFSAGSASEEVAFVNGSNKVSGTVIFNIVSTKNSLDFGTGSTVSNMLRLDNGGTIATNAPYYAQGSTLDYATGGTLNLTSTEYSWKTGTLGSTPGVPWNVEINSSGTDVRTSDNQDRTVRNDFSILSGTFELGTSGFLSGNLTVGGDWQRNASGTSFVPNQNKVTFNSSVNASTQAQSITINGGGNETFYDLEENNSLGLTLSGTTKAYVTAHLYLTNGIITTGSNEVYVSNSASGSISGYQTNPSLGTYLSSSRINGNLRRAVVVSNNYDFPIGTSSNYELATIKFSNVASITNVLGFFTSGTSGTFTNCSINGTSITGMLNGGYWTMTPTGTTSGAIYDLTLYETGYSNSILSSNYIGLIKRSSSLNPWSGTSFGSDGTHVNSTQVLYSGPVALAKRTSIPTFSDYAIGYSNNIVLPIELIDFIVNQSGNDAWLSWNTASEFNSDYFGVERSFDGENFVQIGSVPAAGYSLTPLNYSYDDDDINEFSSDKIYYRLRMVDQDQTYKYSVVRWINFADHVNETHFSVFPNPFTDAVSVWYNSVRDEQAVIQLCDVSGKIIFEQPIKVSIGNNFFTMNQFSSLVQGIYLLHFNSDRIAFTQKILKE